MYSPAHNLHSFCQFPRACEIAKFHYSDKTSVNGEQFLQLRAEFGLFPRMDALENFWPLVNISFVVIIFKHNKRETNPKESLCEKFQVLQSFMCFLRCLTLMLAVIHCNSLSLVLDCANLFQIQKHQHYGLSSFLITLNYIQIYFRQVSFFNCFFCYPYSRALMKQTNTVH